VVCAARGTEALESLREQITSAGGRAATVPTDIADPAAVRHLADEAERRFGRVDTWVNVAAVGVYGRVVDIPDEEFRRVLEVNFLGHVYATRAALPALRRAGGGTLIGVSSVEASQPIPLQAPYAASKCALQAFYDTLRMELAADREPVTVTTIRPASIATPFFEHARSRIGAMPKPPPPTYAPELVADAILYAAEHPRRDIPVGGAAGWALAGRRLAPAMTDAVMSLVGLRMQRSRRPDDGTDNLYEPEPGPGRVHGRHTGHMLRRSPFTAAAQRVVRPAELLMQARARPPAPRRG
jgi:NAD(P)-dependent dehydrogenase (short-subunit alcohol dehydrogenase family)